MSNALIQGKLPNGKVQDLSADWGGGVVTISHEHAKVHAGELKSSGYLAAAVANGSNIEVLVQAHASYDVHLYVNVSAGGDSQFDYFRDITFTTEGTVLTPINHNTNYADGANCTVSHTPTGGVYGTSKWPQYFPGGTAGQSPGVIDLVSTEQMVLKAGTNALFRLTNQAGTAQTLNIAISFYEVAAN